jgi:hypothetical protein
MRNLKTPSTMARPFTRENPFSHQYDAKFHPNFGVATVFCNS